MGVHDGHRKRLRERFVEHGLTSFNDINSLELLLAYAIPRKDTNELAHKLLDTFGSLRAVFEASHHELLAVEGIGENAAVLISLIPQIYKKASVCEADRIKKCNSTELIVRYLQPRFLNERDEILIMLCLDSGMKVINCVEVARGVVNAVETNSRRITELALKSRATFVALAHNHPDGMSIPSVEDDFFTRQIKAALDSVQIKLIDHIIFAGEEWSAYSSMGFLL